MKPRQGHADHEADVGSGAAFNTTTGADNSHAVDFHASDSSAGGCSAGEELQPLGCAEVDSLLDRLTLGSPAHTDAERIERIAGLERLKNALAAAQATETVAFADSQLREQMAAGITGERLGRGIADQIALARHESPHTGSTLLGLARALTTDLPHTMTALEQGAASEHQACQVLAEIIFLDQPDRRAVDAELGPQLGSLSARQAKGRARARAQGLDPAGAVARNERAVKTRRVSLRPAPDGMTRLSAILPLTDGIAALTALEQLAKNALNTGDERSRGQLMADHLIARVTGRDTGIVPLRLALVITDATLLGADDTPASIPGHGTLPAAFARTWIKDTLNAQATCAASEQDLLLLNRLFTSPNSRDLVAMETTSRAYTGLLRLMVALRDQTCRTPYCDAPIRDIDHITRWADGGTTTYHDGRGLCQRCNLARETPAGTPNTPHHQTRTQAQPQTRAQTRPTPSPPQPPPATPTPAQHHH